MNTKKLVLSALMAALSCVATMIIKIPTPTMGYIHPGDAVVLLSGFLLGPLYGGLAAGIGSMFADLFSGYVSYAPATLIIKALTAIFAVLIATALQKVLNKAKGEDALSAKAMVLTVLPASLIGEAFMVLGYFVFEIFLMGLSAGDGFSSASLAAGAASAVAGIPFNIVQGLFGAVIATILYPVLKKNIKDL
jgi:uncharacterized membrane protein